MGKETATIIRVPISTPTLPPHTTTNCYLIGNDKESILVDAGYDLPETKIELEKAIKENGLAIPKFIIITHAHRDHAPGVRQLIDWNPVVYCHEYEKQAVEKAISPWNAISFLHDGDIMNIAGEEITFLHAPGHTAGQLNIYLPSQQILVAGDNIVAEGTSWIGPPDGDMTDYIRTLERLKQLKLKKIAPGHGDWVLNPYEQIEFVIKRRYFRENQIKELLDKHHKLTAAELTEMIYEKLPHPSVIEVAKRTTEAHLMKLVKEGTVKVEHSVYSLLNVNL
ncbi:MBL fold metallo-hydrolase [Neobacillus fumarioli]|uniref:MBL fold metallo-hydrolase n=1 Tax=Neobacillus fumarioli TaxID=105229 RepID=UPI0008350AFB|nr:MBL fold metallo-hydrolase [Neobacillus fumarioli]